MPGRHRAVRALAPLACGAAVLAAPGPAAAYPGINGAVAFTSTEHGARHIFVTTPTGTRDLTGAHSAATDTQPRFSPDGRRIVFTRYDPGHLRNSEIFVMSAGGSGRRALTRTSAGNSDPTWSPDGRSIAFVSTRAGARPDIFVMRADGKHVRRITRDDAGESELAWSPRSSRIAFVREPAGGGDRDVYSIGADGSGLRDLTDDPGAPDVAPAWSPDGARIVYSGPGHPKGSVGADLWIVNADGSGRHALEHEGNGYSDGSDPAWSPDGTTIAFAANDGTGYEHVWSVPAAGGENTELVANAVPGGNPVDRQVDWQPRPTPVVAPQTRIKRATIRARGHRAAFRFSGRGAVRRYQCALRRGTGPARFTACRSPKRYAHLRPGRYTFAVRAVGRGGRDATPATRRFRIR